MEPLVLLLIVGGVAVAIWVAVQHQKKVERAWTSAAQRLGLSYEPPRLFSRPSMSGEVHGCRVRVEVYRRSSGKHSENFTRYRAYYPEPLRLGLRLKREGMFSGVSKFFGSQDIEVGDPQFDGAVMVKGADPVAVTRFLTPSRRMRVMRLFEAYNGCEFRDEMIRWSRRGTETNADALVSTVRRLAQTARMLAGGQPADDALDAALVARREGRLEDALVLTRRAAAAAPEPNPESRMLEGDILYAGGQYENAAEAYAEAGRIEPADPEPAEWAQHSRGKTAEVAPAAENTATAGPGSEEVCRDLFETGGLSLQISRVFEERYADRPIRWSGVLRSVRSYAFDLVFGKEPGVKMVVDLHEVKSGVFGRMVQAVVQLPKEAEEALKERVGERVAFEGRLVRCDAFARNLFVADGRLA